MDCRKHRVGCLHTSLHTTTYGTKENWCTNYTQWLFDKHTHTDALLYAHTNAR